MSISLTPGSRLSAISTLMAQAPQSVPSTRILSELGAAALALKDVCWIAMGHLDLFDMTPYMHPLATIESRHARPAKADLGDLAKSTGTKVVTIRYYEQIGLLPAPPRTAGRFRAYRPQDLARLHFVRRCRDLGFTLDQVRDLLGLATQEDRDCADVDRTARKHLHRIERKIADLRRLAMELRRISAQCSGGTIAECRIIEALSP